MQVHLKGSHRNVVQLLGLVAAPPSMFAVIRLSWHDLASLPALQMWPSNPDDLLRGCRDITHALEHLATCAEYLTPRISDFMLVPQASKECTKEQRGIVQLNLLQLSSLGVPCDLMRAAVNVLNAVLAQLSTSSEAQACDELLQFLSTHSTVSDSIRPNDVISAFQRLRVALDIKLGMYKDGVRLPAAARGWGFVKRLPASALLLPDSSDQQQVSEVWDKLQMPRRVSPSMLMCLLTAVATGHVG